MSTFQLLFSFVVFALIVSLINGNDIVDRGEERCNAERCRHNGRCIEQESEFGIVIVKCQCQVGFYGEFCEIKDNPLLQLLLNDPPYMHSNPKDAWGQRYETEGIRPFFENTRHTLVDILDRFYRNLAQLQKTRDSSAQSPSFK